MEQNGAENRRSSRETLRLPVQVEMVEENTTAAKVFFGYTYNVNSHGLGLQIASKNDISRNSELILNIDTGDDYKSIKLPTRVVWYSNSYCGLEFVRENELVQELLRQTSKSYKIEHPKITKFYPYIGDQDVDTGKHEFFPYADKFVVDFKKVREYMVQLKKGEVPLDVANYFYAQYAVADSELNRSAVLSAHKAFLEFRKFSLERRRKILDDIRELLILEKEKLLELMIIEGHPRKLAEWEYSGMLTAHLAESLDYYQSELIKTVGNFDNETLIAIRRPEGVICVCPPKNAACSNSLTASFALLAGNTLVIKPPLNAPVSTIYLWRNIVGKALRSNGAPKGTINIVMGNSSKFMEDWLDSPYVKGVLMFNDSDKGIELGKKIFEKGKKPILELSGNDYMIVWKDAPIEEAADSLLDCFMGSTQICMVPKKALIHKDIYDAFMKVFIEKVKALKVGLPGDPETILSPVVKIRDFFQHLEDAIQNGANVLTGGSRINHLGEKSDDGLYLLPTVIDIPMERANMMRCMNEENFFPLLPVVRMKGGGISEREIDRNIFQRMIEFIEQNQYGLRLSVWVRDPYYLRKFIEESHHSGLLRINSRHIGFSKCLSTHGGIGRTGGPFGEMNYIWQKASHLQGISVTMLEAETSDPKNLNLSKEEDKN